MQITHKQLQKKEYSKTLLKKSAVPQLNFFLDLVQIIRPNIYELSAIIDSIDVNLY